MNSDEPDPDGGRKIENAQFPGDYSSFHEVTT